MTTPRETSLQLLQNILETKSSVSTLPLSSEAKDNAFITMLVLTSLRHLVYIRKILKNLINKKLSQQNSLARYALILGTAELLYLNQADYAVINSYVTIVKSKTDRYVGGFVNAVLRKISRTKKELIAADKGEFFPQSFRTLVHRDYSSKSIAAIEKASVTEPLLDITCVLASSAKALNGTILPLGSIRLAHKGKIPNLPDYAQGTWWVQDFSSSLPVKMLGAINGKKVLDLCAAPGGKTAQLLHAGAQVTCLDISAERLNLLKTNLARLHLNPRQVICQDGLDFLAQTTQKFDIILLDAPCSATGTLRRHPEIVHLKTLDDISRQSALQKQFLALVDKALLPHGILLYCTCSLCKDEGEHQISSFLQNNPHYSVVNLAPKIPNELSSIITPEGYIRVLPQHLKDFGGADGFFIACLQKGNQS